MDGTVLRLSVNGSDVEARMVDNATARESVQLQSLTINMLGREAAGSGLPAGLLDEGPRRTEPRATDWPSTTGTPGCEPWARPVKPVTRTAPATGREPLAA